MVKSSMPQEDLTILKVYVPNYKASEKKDRAEESNRQVYKDSRGLRHPRRSNRQRRDKRELNNTSRQRNPTGACRHSPSDGTHSPQAPRDLSWAIKDTLTSLKEQKLYSLLSYHNGITLKIITERPNRKI